MPEKNIYLACNLSHAYFTDIPAMSFHSLSFLYIDNIYVKFGNTVYHKTVSRYSYGHQLCSAYCRFIYILLWTWFHSELISRMTTWHYRCFQWNFPLPGRHFKQSFLSIDGFTNISYRTYIEQSQNIWLINTNFGLVSQNL